MLFSVKPCLGLSMQIIKGSFFFIDYDPRTVEQKELQQPSCLPLSYVLRFFTDTARKESLDTKRKIILKPPSFGTQSNTPTGRVVYKLIFFMYNCVNV